jgi:hypothetical protein
MEKLQKISRVINGKAMQIIPFINGIAVNIISYINIKDVKNFITWAMGKTVKMFPCTYRSFGNFSRYR